jgi:hypothetical protein
MYLIASFIKIAEDHPNLNIRGTALYCINLLSKTSYGLEEVKKT